MYILRSKDERGKSKSLWLDSSHTFSFAEYYDAAHMGFGDLRVINDDIVSPDGGFSLHRHDNMEIISVILSGKLEHKDSKGHSQILSRGDVQVMTAGSGIMHSEYNPSSVEPVHFLQIWIMTNKRNLEPSYEQKTFDESEMKNKLHLIVSGNGREDSLKINQDADIYQMHLDRKIAIVNFELNENRKYWIQIAQGAVEVNKQILVAGDGLAIAQEKGFIEFKGVDEESNILLFHLAQ